MEREDELRLLGGIDKIKEDVNHIKVKMAELPCETHKVMINNQKQRFKFIGTIMKAHWGLTVLILSGMVGLAWNAFK